jgi:hypothetical protein
MMAVHGKHPQMTDPTPASALASSAFRQSRIFAEGWNAARGSAKPAPNPYVNEPERSRWLEGYSQGDA